MSGVTQDLTNRATQDSTHTESSNSEDLLASETRSIVYEVLTTRVKARRIEQMRRNQNQGFEPERQPRNKEDTEQIEGESETDRL